jgi:hypothetical protein
MIVARRGFGTSVNLGQLRRPMAVLPDIVDPHCLDSCFNSWTSNGDVLYM